MIKSSKQKLVRGRNLLIYWFYALKAKVSSNPLPKDSSANFAVSIASYPKRDLLLPAVFQALSRQTVSPKKWILVLSVEDYVNGLPHHLTKLEKRGLEILWVEDNPYAVKKFIPVAERYPNLAIVTLDDDIIYHPSLLEGLVNQSEIKQTAVIGYVGKAMVKRNNDLHLYYREKEPASITTPPEQVYLIGWGGIYYPPHCLDKRVLNMEAVHKTVPGRGSDFWFWAAAHANGTQQQCLGVPNEYNLGIPIPQNNETKPKDQPKGDVVPKRFQMTIDYFGIREKLLEVLPNKEVN